MFGFIIIKNCLIFNYLPTSVPLNFMDRVKCPTVPLISKPPPYLELIYKYPEEFGAIVGLL